MTISSRTPEGEPHRCSVCGKVSNVEPAFPCSDACCPSCGHWLSWFRDRLGADLGINPISITLSTSFADDIGSDSLDIFELVLELESEFGLTLSERRAANIKTVRDVILWIERHRSGGG